MRKDSINTKTGQCKQSWWLLLILSMLLGPDRVAGQTTFGTITGTVTDSSKAVIPGATVRAINEGTGVERKVTTTETGVFVAANLNGGAYRLRIEMPNFTPYEQAGLILRANQVLNVDAELSPAATAATVNVAATASSINTQTPTINNTTSAEQLTQLPVITRQKGDQGLWGYEAYNVGISHVPFFTANGSRYIDTQPTVDGITAMSFQTGVGGSTVQPGIEATAEVSVQLSNAPAEFGRPVQMTMVSKSGTNEFHGGVFEDYNGNALNARDFFSSSAPPFRVYNN